MRRLALPLLLLSAHAALGLWAIRTFSATCDEPELLSAGYTYWTRDMRMNVKAPPLALMWDALPLLGRTLVFPEGPEWTGAFSSAFGERFLYWSGNDGDALIERARLMPLLLSLAVAAALWLACRRAFGDGPALVALAFYAFSPTILAHASLATTDLAVAGWSALSALAFAAFLRRPSRALALAAGLLAAAAFLSKYSGVLTPAGLAGALILDARARPQGRGRRLALAAAWGALPAAALCAAVVGGSPTLRQGFLSQWSMVRTGAPVFLLGRVYSNGCRWFYAACVLFKSTLPELAALAAFALLAWRRRLRLAPEALCAAGVMTAYFVGASCSGKQLGVRYLLPAYALLPVLAGCVSEALLRKPRGAWAAAALAAWQAASALGVAPDFIPYFNEAVGGPAGGARLLSDSNLDWGQDLKRLGAYVDEQGRPEVILSYFGGASPEAYGIRAQQLGSHNKIQRRWMNSPAPRRELLVMSLTNAQGVYAHPPGLFSWALDMRPLAVVGRSLLVFDVTADAQAHRHMAEAYALMDDRLLASHELERARRIDDALGPAAR